MKLIPNQKPVPAKTRFLRRIAERFCESRRESILREIEYHRHLFDALGIGPIG